MCRRRFLGVVGVGGPGFAGETRFGLVVECWVGRGVDLGERTTLYDSA